MQMTNIGMILQNQEEGEKRTQAKKVRINY